MARQQIRKIVVNGFEILVKTCSKCGVEKSLDDFHVKANGLGGRKSVCKDCTKAYHEDLKKRKAQLQLAGSEPKHNTTEGVESSKAKEVVSKVVVELERQTPKLPLFFYKSPESLELNEPTLSSIVEIKNNGCSAYAIVNLDDHIVKKSYSALEGAVSALQHRGYSVVDVKMSVMS